MAAFLVSYGRPRRSAYSISALPVQTMSCALLGQAMHGDMDLLNRLPGGHFIADEKNSRQTLEQARTRRMLRKKTRHNVPPGRRDVHATSPEFIWRDVAPRYPPSDWGQKLLTERDLFSHGGSFCFPHFHKGAWHDFHRCN